MAYRTSQEPDRRPRAAYWFADKTDNDRSGAATASDGWRYPDEQDEGGSAPFLTELPSRAVTSGKRAGRLSSRREAVFPGPVRPFSLTNVGAL
jgi:hypothetical protein